MALFFRIAVSPAVHFAMSVKSITGIEYDELLSAPGNADLQAKLIEAFGQENSLGIIAIRSVPEFLEARSKFLPMAHSIAHLDSPSLDELTDPESFYNTGWSHGKEKLGDKPDFSKASYYFNPLTDLPGTPELREKYPASYPCNKWPTSACPNFEGDAKILGKIMHDAVVHLASHIDYLASSRLTSYRRNLLSDAMRNTDKAKGRLLYYFPIENSEDSFVESLDDSWIGWHNDSGFLTALAGDIYINDESGEVLDKSLIDPSAGLYALDRSGNTVKIDIPEDCMAVQIGECTQIVTGGVVIATPHCVRGGGLIGSNGDSSKAKSVKVARISNPCFIDTGPTFELRLPPGCSRLQAIGAGVGDGIVPPLGDRWVADGMTFGDFLQKTFSMYYDWSKRQ